MKLLMIRYKVYRLDSNDGIVKSEWLPALIPMVAFEYYVGYLLRKGLTEL